VILGVGLAAGAAIVLSDRFDAVATAALVQQRGVTMIAGAPPMFSAWLDAPAVPDGAFASVRLAVSGAAPLAPDVQRGFRDRFGVVVHQGYGLTEASPIVTTSAVATVRDGSIGPPLPGIDVRLVDASGDDALAGDPGEIWVRGPNVFAGYWNDDEATARVLTRDGWLCTGDVAVADDDGWLTIVDRAKDLILVSGFNVYPAEVEEVLMQHPMVAEAAVVGVPDVRTGESVQAFVVRAAGAVVEEAELTAFAARHLARYKCPTTITFVTELPHTEAGKVLRRNLQRG
jgi:long-chain acyl-CoA synthetase